MLGLPRGIVRGAFTGHRVVARGQLIEISHEVLCGLPSRANHSPVSNRCTTHFVVSDAADIRIKYIPMLAVSSKFTLVTRSRYANPMYQEAERTRWGLNDRGSANLF